MSIKHISPNDIAEMRLIFNKDEEIPDSIVLAGYKLDLIETEKVGCHDPVTQEDYRDTDPPTIHAFYINPFPYNPGPHDQSQFSLAQQWNHDQLRPTSPKRS